MNLFETMEATLTVGSHKERVLPRDGRTGQEIEQNNSFFPMTRLLEIGARTSVQSPGALNEKVPKNPNYFFGTTLV